MEAVPLNDDDFMDYFENNERNELDKDARSDHSIEEGEMSESDSDIPLEDIDSMLDESLRRNKSPNDPSAPVPEERKKTVLKSRRNY